MSYDLEYLITEELFNIFKVIYDTNENANISHNDLSFQNKNNI